MVVDIIPSQSFPTGPSGNLEVEPVTEVSKKDVFELIHKYCPERREVSMETAFVFYASDGDSRRCFGAICLEPNDVRTKFVVKEEDKEARNHHEITYLLLDNRFFTEISLVPLLRQVFSMSVNVEEETGEVFWFAGGDRLYSRILNKVIKKSHYYFQNEAKYFARHIVDAHSKTDSTSDGSANCTFPFREDGSMMSAEEIREVFRYGALNEKLIDFKPIQTNLTVEDLTEMGYVSTADLMNEISDIEKCHDEKQ